jgi:lipoprotein-releasing system permease protein
MSVTTFIARRFMQAGRTNRFFSWISILTISGVAIGVAAMIVVWSVINGFETELRGRFLAANAHVMAYRFPHGLTDYEQWVKTVRDDFGDDITGISPFIHYETMGRNESIMHAMLIRGIDPEARDKVQSLRPIVRPPEALEIIQLEIKDAAENLPAPMVPSIILGTGLLSLLDAKVGDEMELVEPEKKNFGNMKKFKIVGVYDSGLKHYDNRLGIMSIPTAQRFFKMGKRVIGLEVGLKDPWESKQIAEDMTKKYSISIREWQSFNRRLFEAMQMERVVILIITSFVAAVASCNILTTIFVAVSQRQRDISILKSLGANNRQVLSMFLKQGAYIGVVGCFFGVLLALGISAILERYQFIDLPDLYLLAKLPMTYSWWVYALVCSVSIVIAIGAGLLPAVIAARVNPVEGFRGNMGTD